jgi:iron complex outermembrane receptor protein
MKPAFIPATPSRWLVLGALLPVALASAQGTKPASEDEAVQLSPFTVNSGNDSYYSPEAISGTRTKTELINLPMNLQVLTEQFIKDVGATDLVDVVTYTSGAVAAPATSGDTAQGDTTGFTIRGFGSHLPYRNGFRRVRIVDTTNIARVEVIKGPSSVLYGTAFAGGSINYITKRPVQKSIEEFTFRVGSYDFYRSEADVNIPIIPKKLAVRFVGAYEDSKSWTARMHTDLKLLNPSVTYWFRPDSYITLEYEKSKKAIDGYRGQLPFHPLLDLQRAGLPINRSWNTHAAGDYMDQEMDVYTAEFVHRFTRNFTLRANYTREEWVELSRRNGDSVGLTTANAYTASPIVAPLRLPARSLNAYARRGSWDDYMQAELLNNFTIKGVEVQTLFGAQRSVEDFKQLLATASPGTNGGTVNGIPRRGIVQWNLNDPSTWIVTEETEAMITGYASNSGNRGRSRFDTMYASNQLSLFDGKLRTMLGYRIDKFQSDGHGPTITPAGLPISPVVQNPRTTLPRYKTPQYGLLYKPFKNVSLFAQYSESVVNLFTTLQRREDGTAFVPTPGRGEGYDVGVKADLLDGRVNATASVFRVDNANIVRILATRPDPNNPGLTFTPADQGGVQRSEGFDIDVRLRPFKGNQVVFSYANIDAYVLEATEAVTINGVQQFTRLGHQLANSPRHSSSIWIRQDLGNFGWLKGVHVAGGARYVGQRPVSDTYNVVGYTSFTLNPGQTAIAANGGNVNFVGGSLQPSWTLNSYTVFDLAFGGNFQIGKIRYRAAVNLKNIADKNYLVQRYHFGAPRTGEFRLTVAF